MKNLFLLLFILSTPTFANKAKTIMQEVDKRDKGETLLAKYTMEIRKGNKVKNRDLLWWRLDKSPKIFNLIKIQAPKKLKNTGLLILTDKEGEDNTWLYLSAAAKKIPRKIATDKKDSKFLGSDFYYADFEEVGVDEFTHRHLGEAIIKNWKCDKIESVPKDQTYVYERVISYIDKKSKVVVKSELFKEKTKIKTFEVLSMKLDSNIWTITDSTMTSHKKNSFTKLTLLKNKYNTNLLIDFFSQESLIRDF